VLFLVRFSLFAAESAALHAVSLTKPGSGSRYWTVGGLAIAGVFVLLPFVLEGLQRAFLHNEMWLGEKVRPGFLAFSSRACQLLRGGPCCARHVGAQTVRLRASCAPVSTLF
jgi:hypothetical protein